MFNTIHFVKSLRTYSSLAFLLCVVCVFTTVPDFAHASGTGSDPMPYATALQNLKASITGPVAFTISLIGVVGAGAMLIFGGDMSGFLRTMVFLILVIAIIVNASNLVDMIALNGSTIAAHVDRSVQMLRGIS